MIECEIIEYPSDSDIVGKTFNYIEIIKKISRGANGKGGKYLVKCVCGESFICAGSKITSGHKKSCGCKRNISISNKKLKITIGKTYGELKVIGGNGMGVGGKIIWRCLYSCGKETDKSTSYLINSKTRTCGINHFV